MKTMEVELQLHAFVTSALDGDEWSASLTPLHPRGKAITIPIW